MNARLRTAGHGRLPKEHPRAPPAPIHPVALDVSDARIHYRGPCRTARLLIAELEGEGLAVSHGPINEAPMIGAPDDTVQEVFVWVGAGAVNNVAAAGLKTRIVAAIGRFRGRHPQADVSIT